MSGAPQNSQNDGYFVHTRRGFNKGIKGHARREYSWVTSIFGTIIGGASGIAAGKTASKRIIVRNPAMAFVTTPVVMLSCISFAGLGKELAEPFATLGIKIGKTVRLTTYGLSQDLFGGDALSQQEIKEDFEFYRPPALSSSQPPVLPTDTIQVPENIKIRPDTSFESSGAERYDRATVPTPVHLQRNDMDNARQVNQICQELLHIRAKEKAIKEGMQYLNKSSVQHKSYQEELRNMSWMKADLKRTGREVHGVNVSKLIDDRARSLGESLMELRAKQVVLRAELRGLPQGHPDRSRLTRGIRLIDMEKKELKKQYATAYHGSLAYLVRDVERGRLSNH